MDYRLGSGFEPRHIDRKSLYTSLEERIKYLHHFLDFNSGTEPTCSSRNNTLTIPHQPM